MSSVGAFAEYCLAKGDLGLKASLPYLSAVVSSKQVLMDMIGARYDLRPRCGWLWHSGDNMRASTVSKPWTSSAEYHQVRWVPTHLRRKHCRWNLRHSVCCAVNHLAVSTMNDPFANSVPMKLRLQSHRNSLRAKLASAQISRRRGNLRLQRFLLRQEDPRVHQRLTCTRTRLHLRGRLPKNLRGSNLLKRRHLHLPFEISKRHPLAQ